MAHRAFHPRFLVLISLLIVLSITISCGGTAAEPIVVEKEVIREVIKEVPVEKVVIKEIIKEVIVEREVIVEKEVIKEVFLSKPPTAEASNTGGMEGFPVPGKDGVPADAGKLTVAMDSWGVSDINPWTISSVMFLQDMFNGTVMRQAPNGELMPYWAVSYELDRRASPIISTPTPSSRTAPRPTPRP